MRNLYLFAIVALLCTGCVRVNLPSIGTVSGSIEAGKNAYDEAKIKRQGGKKRELTSQVSLSDHDSRDEAEDVCMSGLKEKMAQYSPLRDPIVISEKIEILAGKPDAIIECQLIGYAFGDADTDKEVEADASA